MEIGANSISIVRYREGNVIVAGSGAQAMTLYHKVQPPQTIEAQRNEEVEDEADSGNEERKPKPWRRQERCTVKATSMAYHPYHTFD